MFDETLLKTELPQAEEKILQAWKSGEVFQKSLALRKNAKPFIFFEGPPTANGKPGVHHVLSRIMKDVFCRYKSMDGYYVGRKAGWDTHGLPVELEVEKELKLSATKFNQFNQNMTAKANVFEVKIL
jgi:isoleucyl-tRNA synthetase